MEPDILYAVRPGEQNDSLRLSLRSLANLPHRRVFIAGYCPEWVRGVTVIEVRRKANKFDAIQENVRQAVRHPDLGEKLVYMNDDFFITNPIEAVPIMHGGLISSYSAVQELRIRMRRTYASLRDLFPEHDLLAYDGVHAPFPLERDAIRFDIECVPRGALWRTWHGNKRQVGGIPISDCKSRTHQVGELPTFFSTAPKSFRAYREQLEDILPKECLYV